MEKEAELLYSAAQKKTGRRYFLSFALVNTVAVNFLAGHVILLFFIRLKANNTFLGIVYPFLIIHAKRGYLFSDNRTILLTFAGGAGSIAGILLSRHFTDRYGSKPLMHFFVLQILLVGQGPR
jgi:hypothetical protein